MSEHCAEHESRGRCIVTAKKDAESAHKRIDALVTDIKGKLPTWVFNTCLTLLVIVFGGIFTLLFSISDSVNDISKIQIQMLTREEYRERARQ